MTSARRYLSARPGHLVGLLAVLAPACAPEAGAVAQGESEAGRPNILFVLADDLAYGDLACFGNPVVQTPHLDRLATQGVRLTHGYGASPNCSPARAALLTGRMPYRVGIYDFVRETYPLHIPLDETSIATLLRDAGYDTFLVGKWHLSGGQLDDERRKYSSPGDYGFTTWLANRNSFDFNPTTLVRNGKPAGKLAGFQSNIVIRETIQWLEEGRDPEKPFCAFVWMHEPHEPVRADKRYQDLYADLGDETDALGFGGPDVDRSRADPDLRQRFFGAVSQMDAEIGRLLGKLEELGLAQNTFVYFTSDNGPESRYPTSWGSPGPLRGAKGHVWEGGIRVPGIVRWPGHVEPGTVCDEPINGTDLLPTLCAVAGIEPRTNKPLDGVNALPAMTACGVLEREKPLFWWLYHARGGKQVAMRIDDHKILARMIHPDQPVLTDLFPPPEIGLMNFIKDTGIEGFELYDVVQDPGETRELSEDEPQLFQEMRAKLLALYDEIQREGPVWDKEGIVPPPREDDG